MARAMLTVNAAPTAVQRRAVTSAETGQVFRGALSENLPGFVWRRKARGTEINGNFIRREMRWLQLKSMFLGESWKALRSIRGT